MFLPSYTNCERNIKYVKISEIEPTRGSNDTIVVILMVGWWTKWLLKGWGSTVNIMHGLCLGETVTFLPPCVSAVTGLQIGKKYSLVLRQTSLLH